MKIQTLKALLRIAETGSIRSAAASLHVSQPALTLAIQQLEEEVGAQLLTRTNQGVLFTCYGEALLKRARLIISESERIQEEIAQMRGHWEGEIRLSSSPAIFLSILPHALRPFMAKYPKVRVHCMDGLSPMVNPALRSGVLDFAVTPVQPGDVESGMVADPLLEREIVVAAHESNPLAKATCLEQLLSARWAYASPSPGPGAVIEKAFRTAGLSPPAPVMICESLLALPDIIANSDLIVTLPYEIFKRAHKTHKLCAVPLRDPIPTVQIAILRMESIPLTPAAQELISWIKFAAEK